MDSYKNGRQWDAFSDLSVNEQSILTWPVLYRYKAFSWFFTKKLDWWKPDKNNTLWFFSKSDYIENADEEFRTTELIEKDGEVCRVYILKSSWVKPPQKINKMFNDLRKPIKESALFPFRGK